MRAMNGRVQLKKYLVVILNGFGDKTNRFKVKCQS
jgi:hypothetical protein